jgi:hypothetical protein
LFLDTLHMVRLQICLCLDVKVSRQKCIILDACADQNLALTKHWKNPNISSASPYVHLMSIYEDFYG